MSETVLVNLFAGPGSGKTTLSLGIAHELKMRGFEAHVTPEVAKSWALAGVKIDEAVQLQIMHEQFKSEQQYYGLVDFIISDSPMENNGFYCWLRNQTDDYLNIVKRLREQNPIATANFWILRSKEYNPRGRYQTAQEAVELGVRMGLFLDYLEIVETDIHDPKQFVETFLCRE